MAVYAAPAAAHMTNKAVETRQAAMRTLGGAMSAINAYPKQDESAAAEIEAKVLVAAGLAGELPALFPEGTGKDTTRTEGVRRQPRDLDEMGRFFGRGRKSRRRGPQIRRHRPRRRQGRDRRGFVAFGKSACGGRHRAFRTKRPK